MHLHIRNWTCSYLLNRKFYDNGLRSTLRDAKSGMEHGSSAGPLIHNIYTDASERYLNLAAYFLLMKVKRRKFSQTYITVYNYKLI